MTCGFTTLKKSKKFYDEIISHKPDIIEFGLPFSDPMADGPIIQESSKIALKSKITTKQSLNLISQLNKKSEKTAFVY
jgi:tryptophan synthase alpha chain